MPSSSAARSPQQPTLSAIRASSVDPNNASMDPLTGNGAAKSGGVTTKWKNKLKSFLTSPLPGSSSNNKQPSSPTPPSRHAFQPQQTRDPPAPRQQQSASSDVYLDASSIYGTNADDSYEARLSKLVGDLENVDYGSSSSNPLAQAGDGGQIDFSTWLNTDDWAPAGLGGEHFADSLGASSLNPFGLAGTPSETTHTLHPSSNIDVPFSFGGGGENSSLNPAFDEFISFSAYDDLEVPQLDDYSASTPSSSTAPATSISLSAVESATSQTKSELSSDAESGAAVSALSPADTIKIAQTDSAPPALKRSAVPPTLSSSAQGNETKPRPDHAALFPGDGPCVPVPFNSPVDGIDLGSTNIATLAMPFSFEDLKNMGLVEGGTLDMNGRTSEDDLLEQKQMSANQSDEIGIRSKDSTLDFAQLDLSLFPLPGAIPSPTSDASSGPSPALSYGESSTSNTSFDEALDALHQRNRLYSNVPVHASHLSKGLFKDDASIAQSQSLLKTPTHSPQHSIASIPATPVSVNQNAQGMSTPMPAPPVSPFRRPVVHASALAWRVAPTSLSPKSNIAVNTVSGGLRSAPSVPNFHLPSTPSSNFHGISSISPTGVSPIQNRLMKFNTASSPELKRRRNDEDQLSVHQTFDGSSSLLQRLASQELLSPTRIDDGGLQRPIAGRRRVAAKIVPPLPQTVNQRQPYQQKQQQQQQQQPSIRNSPSTHTPVRSASQQQLYQTAKQSNPSMSRNARIAATQAIPLAVPEQTAWLSDAVVKNLYTQTDSWTYVCMIQGCHHCFGSEKEVKAHIQGHFNATSTLSASRRDGVGASTSINPHSQPQQQTQRHSFHGQPQLGQHGQNVAQQHQQQYQPHQQQTVWI